MTAPRPSALALLLIILAACAEAPREPRAFASLSGGSPDLIEVRVGEDDAVVQEVWLRGPDGEAASGLRVPNESSGTGGGSIGRPEVALGATGGSSSGVKPYVGVGLPLFTSAPPARRGEALYLIPVPAAFARPSGRAGWTIEVRYRDARHRSQSLAIPAPQ